MNFNIETKELPVSIKKLVDNHFWELLMESKEIYNNNNQFGNRDIEIFELITKSKYNDLLDSETLKVLIQYRQEIERPFLLKIKELEQKIRTKNEYDNKEREKELKFYEEDHNYIDYHTNL